MHRRKQMAKNYRHEVRLDESIHSYLKTKENQTEYITKLILKDMSQQSSLLVEIQRLQEEEKKLKIQLKDNELQQQNLQQQLELTREQAAYRAELYEDCVETLKLIKTTQGYVTLSEIREQSERCSADLSLFKQWLFDDGVYDDLLK